MLVNWQWEIKPIRTESGEISLVSGIWVWSLWNLAGVCPSESGSCGIELGFWRWQHGSLGNMPDFAKSVVLVENGATRTRWMRNLSLRTGGMGRWENHKSRQVLYTQGKLLVFLTASPPLSHQFILVCPVTTSSQGYLLSCSSLL